MSQPAQVFVRSSRTMPELAMGSVRLLFESPPYEKMHSCCQDRACLACYQGEEFVVQFAKFIPERLRILADDGSYVLNIQPQVINGFISPVEFLLPQAITAAGLRLVQTHLWVKPNANPFAPDRRLKNTFEFFWHFAKTKDYVFDKDALREPHTWAGRDHRTEKYHPLGKDPGNVFVMAKSQDQASSDHPGKMKDGIASRFIKLLSKPGDLVADGFAGTGQTGVEALALGRTFIGYEFHKDRAAHARNRLGIDGAEQETTMSMTKTWMSSKEVASYTSLSLGTIYSKTSRGEIPVHHIGKLPRYHRDEIDAWIRGVAIPPVSTIQPPQDSASPS